MPFETSEHLYRMRSSEWKSIKHSEGKLYQIRHPEDFYINAVQVTPEIYMICLFLMLDFSLFVMCAKSGKTVPEISKIGFRFPFSLPIVAKVSLKVCKFKKKLQTNCAQEMSTNSSGNFSD